MRQIRRNPPRLIKNWAIEVILERNACSCDFVNSGHDFSPLHFTDTGPAVP
jgi:hypothetical protein